VFKDSNSNSATHVFNQILGDSYAGWAGFHTCLTTSTPNQDLCWAELHKRGLYRVVELNIDTSHSDNPVPTEVAHHTPHPRAPIHIAAPEGFGTANSRDYGWEYLMQTVPMNRLPVTLLAVDGDPTAFPPEMFSFRCTGVPTKITCRNSLGDYLSYTPNKT
jgi:hypothetical protein